ncbi:hypothetical protein BOO71_0003658 [Deinococcus marmoris]|uniref:Uncharacterized protein n=1 Tax=Deinococcus marmoris TaxID=249408 RepID=A0A1U7P205_9DEIO|nr:hypothetical protein BOO71_0003658 [Deinococcus marmoris]
MGERINAASNWREPRPGADCHDHGPAHDQTLIVLMLHTSLRAHEVCAHVPP